MADIDSITHLVQQALTPAFLLSGAGTVMVVLSSRLARIVDRGHQLHDQMLSGKNQGLTDELNIIDKRCQTIHHSFYFCVIAAFCICSVIVKSAITPSFIGRIALMFAGALPNMPLASAPTANKVFLPLGPPSWRIATTDGSSRTTPLPRT